MKAIVTVKLPRNPKHDPRNKKIGKCPLKENKLCTDVTGSHHSYIEEGKNRQDIWFKANHKYHHITRIEPIAEKEERPITKELCVYFKKINRETGVLVSTQIMMWRNGYMIKKDGN